MDVVISFAILIISLIVLAKSSEKFTTSAEKIGLGLRISPFIVGVTIVAVGTSLPELISSVLAVLQGNSEIVSGMVIGSNVTNILLILGFSVIVAEKIKIKESFLRIDLMVFITSVFIFVLVAYDNVITIVESSLLFVCFVVYLIYIIQTKKPQEQEIKPEVQRHKLDFEVFFILIASLVLLFLAAKFTLDSIVDISNALNIGKGIIAATAVAFGTSLPELAVSVHAARKGKAEIAIGNVLGSNIFNIFAVVGVAGLLGQIVVPQSLLIIGSLFMIFSTFLYYFSVKDKKFSNWEGMFFILIYVLYVTQILGWA